MSSIRQVIYISKATAQMSSDELRSLINSSARHNKEQGITGALLFVEQSFIQVLEGEEATIERLLVTIRDDPRHMHFRIISDHQQPGRHFSEWSMALVTPPEQDRRQVVRELRAVADCGNSGIDDTVTLRMPETFEMMQHLYRADQVLQNARG